MNYNTKLRCTYNYYDDNFKEINEIKVNDDDLPDDISSHLYRSELLEAFQLEEYNDDIIIEKMNHFYASLKDHELLKPIYKKLAAKLLCEEEEVGFMFLFSYDYFCLMHLCICDFLEIGYLSNDNVNIKKLINYIMK
jgi:hypothetical protein